METAPDWRSCVLDRRWLFVRPWGGWPGGEGVNINPQLDAALELHDFLTAHDLKYAVIGGVALLMWGEPRFTRYVDATLEVPTDLAALVRLMTERFTARVKDPVRFTTETRMLLITVGDVDVDIALAFPGYEDEMFRRVVEFEVEPGRRMRVCSAEDLIIHKAVAGRPQDSVDIQTFIYRQGDALDTAYLRKWLGAFSGALADPQIAERFETAWRER